MPYVEHPLQLSRDLVKIAIEKNEIENFRIYSILRQANIPRGEFTLSQLAGILSPAATAGNAKKLKNNLSSKLNRSIFFEHIQGEKFRAISYKKTLINHKGNARTTFYALPGFTGTSRRAFFDACIGLCLLGKEASNKTAAKWFKCSKGRIQQATRRNNEKGLFTKHIRKAIEPYPTIQAAAATRDKLEQVGIITSNPFEYRGGYAISVNRTNKYTSGVSRRYKGKIWKRTHATQERRIQWFKPAFRGKGSRDIRLYYESRYDAKFYEFNDKVYSFNDFINAHAEM